MTNKRKERQVKVITMVIERSKDPNFGAEVKMKRKKLKRKHGCS